MAANTAQNPQLQQSLWHFRFARDSPGSTTGDADGIPAGFGLEGSQIPPRAPCHGRDTFPWPRSSNPKVQDNVQGSRGSHNPSGMLLLLQTLKARVFSSSGQ